VTVDRTLVTRKLLLIASDLEALRPIVAEGPPFSRDIARAAGLRNRIVHDYDTLDSAKVFEALTGALQDAPRYLEDIHAYLERSARAGPSV
jgi:uncharacterized protein with HEPN domain